MKAPSFPIALLGLSFLALGCRIVLSEQCGSQNNGALCPDSMCCSSYGWCGTTADYCGDGCQSQCSSPSPVADSSQDIGSIVTNDIFNQFAFNINNGNCEGSGFYTYNAFLNAAAAFGSFGTTGDTDTSKRELAAFFANVAHETSGLCYINEISPPSDYCDTTLGQCASGQSYHGRGPLQLSWNYNYASAGSALNFDGINNPNIVATDAEISFKTAVWFWMTPQTPKDSCHNVMLNNEGFGNTINIINGQIECGQSSNAQMQDRVSKYQQFCQILGVDPGSNLTC